jgi:hypothetical protein
MKSVCFTWGGAICASLCLFVISCQKNDHPATQSQQGSTQTLLMNATNDVVQSAALESSNVDDIMGSGDSSTCPAITFDTSTKVFPHVKTIDYGSGCLGKDSIMRTGEKIVTIYAKRDSAAPGTLISIATFQGFTINGMADTGTIKTYVDSSSTMGMRIYKIVSDETLIALNGDSKTFTGTHWWKQMQGGTTTSPDDDVYQITGTSMGTETLDGATQFTYTATISNTNPVIKRVDCNHRVQGSVDVAIHITTGGDANFMEVLDYGTGDCDTKATLSINNGVPQVITLPLYFWPLSL